MVSLRARAKDIAYRSGALGAYHARRNARTLTVLMFHRVLPESEIAATGADPLYAVTPQFLADCVAFLRRHYAIVGLEDVLKARIQAPLPDNAALITFDDGWRDQFASRFAVLENVPWTLFVSADALLDPDCWWQEVLLWSLRSGTATEQQLWRLSGSEPQRNGIDVSHALLMCFSAVPEDVRENLLAPYRAMLREKTTQQMMLAPAGAFRSDAPRREHRRAWRVSPSDDAFVRERYGERSSPCPRSGHDVDRFAGNAGDVVSPTAAIARRCSQRRAHWDIRSCSPAIRVLNPCAGGRPGGDLLGRIPRRSPRCRRRRRQAR